MSITSNILFGIVKGLTGKDLESMPEDIGIFLGEFLKEQTDGSRIFKPDANIRLNNKIKENPEIASEIMKAVIGPEQTKDNDSLLPDYLFVLNLIIKEMQQLKRSIVLQGFLHDEECLSYWHINYDDNFMGYEIRDNKISLVPSLFHPHVYILPTKNGLNESGQLNDDIRRSETGYLDQEKYINEYCIQTIEEFQLCGDITAPPENNLFNEMIDDIDKKNIKCWKIPDGAPGLLTMVSSIPLALEAQGNAKDMINKTMKKIRNDIKPW